VIAVPPPAAAEVFDIEFFFRPLREKLVEKHWSFMDGYADAMIAQGPNAGLGRGRRPATAEQRKAIGAARLAGCSRPLR